MGRIVFAGNTAWGMYNFRGKLMKRLLTLGHEVIVIVPYDEYIHELSKLGLKVETVKLKAKSLNPWFDLRLLIQYYKFLAKLRPDICFFYTIKPNIYASIAASLLKIPHIAITTGLGYAFLSKNMISKIVKVLYKIAFMKTNEVWFLNKDDKGVEVFVRAAETLKRKYPNVTFKLLGMRGVKNPSAIPDEIMDQWIEEKNVVYLGETRDVIPFINDCTCVVLPSYYREGIPFVLLEGASLKRPIITTNGVGCKEVINDGYNGFICEQKDVDSLALAMDKIINAPIEELNMMGENGRDLVQRKYSLDIVFKQYIETISRYL